MKVARKGGQEVRQQALDLADELRVAYPGQQVHVEPDGEHCNLWWVTVAPTPDKSGLVCSVGVGLLCPFCVGAM